MNLLLTGASGFLGRNFLLHAPTDWRILAVYRKDLAFPAFVSRMDTANITVASCDLTNPEETAALFEKHGRDWDCCVYLAAKVDIPWSVRQPKDDLLMNTIPLLNVLDSIRAGRFVYFSSGAVYDGLRGEVSPHALLTPTLPYAISKLTCERYVHFYCERRRHIEQYLIVRFFGAYGPYEAPHKIYTRLVRRFAIEGRNDYTIYGDGQNLIDAMYVDDAVDAIHRMLAGSHWNDTVNLAGGRPVTVETLVREVSEVLDVRDVNIQKQGIAHEANRFWGSKSEMQEFFGFEARRSLSEGIPRLREWVDNHASAGMTASE